MLSVTGSQCVSSHVPRRLSPGRLGAVLRFGPCAGPESVLYCSPVVSRSGCTQTCAWRLVPPLADAKTSAAALAVRIVGSRPTSRFARLATIKTTTQEGDRLDQLHRHEHYLPGLWNELRLDRQRAGVLPEPRLREPTVRCRDCRNRRKAERGVGSSASVAMSTSTATVRRQREMFPAVCDECGRETQVPFQPTSGKPVYCSECFERRRSY